MSAYTDNLRNVQQQALTQAMQTQGAAPVQSAASSTAYANMLSGLATAGGNQRAILQRGNDLSTRASEQQNSFRMEGLRDQVKARQQALNLDSLRQSAQLDRLRGLVMEDDSTTADTKRALSAGGAAGKTALSGMLGKYGYVEGLGSSGLGSAVNQYISDKRAQERDQVRSDKPTSSDMDYAARLRIRPDHASDLVDVRKTDTYQTLRREGFNTALDNGLTPDEFLSGALEASKQFNGGDPSPLQARLLYEEYRDRWAKEQRQRKQEAALLAGLEAG